MKQHLISLFRFNERTNMEYCGHLTQLAVHRTEAIRLMSHLVNCQIKWLRRLEVFPDDPNLSWWDPLYDEKDLPGMFASSTQAWIQYLESQTEDEITSHVKYTGGDGTPWTARLQDIALQLNFHSIHHRAQMQTMLRAEGFTPPFIDYIGTVARKL